MSNNQLPITFEREEIVYPSSDGGLWLDDRRFRPAKILPLFEGLEGITVTCKRGTWFATTHVGTFQFARYSDVKGYGMTEAQRIKIMPNGWPDLSKHSGRPYTKPEPFKFKSEAQAFHGFVWVHFQLDPEPTRLATLHPDKPYDGARIIAKKRGLGFTPVRAPS